MAALVVGGLAAAGATAAGYASWAMLAYTVGSYVGNRLFSSNGSSKVQGGAKLQDNTVTIASYGAVIPQVYGTMRTGANMIWSTPKIPKKHKNRGGKGNLFKRDGETTYTYSISCAYLLTDTEISAVRRIWSSGSLVYDNSETNASANSSIAASNIKIYLGTDTQMPDPVMESIKGQGNVPAYRGRSYIVFSNLQLGTGTIMPVFTFEIVSLGGETIYINSEITDQVDGNYEFTYFDEEYQRFIGVRGTGGVDKAFTIVDLNNGNTIRKNFPLQVTTSYSNLQKFGDKFIIPNATMSSGNKGNLILDNNLNFDSSSSYKNFNNYIETVANVEKFVYSPENLEVFGLGTKDHTLTTLIMSPYFDPNYEVTTDFFYSNYEFNDQNSLNNQYSKNSKNVGLVSYKGHFYWLQRVDDYTLHIIEMEANIKEPKVIATIENFSWFNNFNNTFNVDEVSGNILITGYDNIQRDPAFYNETKQVIVKYNIKNKVQERARLIDLLMAQDASLVGAHFATNVFDFTANRQIVLAGLNHNFSSDAKNYIVLFVGVDSFSDVVLQRYKYTTDTGYDVQYYNKTQQSILYKSRNVLSKLVIDRHTKSDAYLEDIIKEKILVSGLTLDDIDTTEIEDIKVHGYLMNQQTNLQSVIGQLLSVYDFAIANKDYKMKFINNKQNIKKIINIKELGAMNFQPGGSFENDLTTERTGQLSLPRSVDVRYYDLDRDYNLSNQSAVRETALINNATNSLDCPFALTANEAKELAQRTLYSAYVQRDAYSFETNYNHADVDVGDVIQIQQDVLKTMKITNKNSDGGIIKFKAISYDSLVFDQSNAIGGQTNYVPTPIEVFGRSELFLLDIPLITNFDFIGLYSGSASSSRSTKWLGSELYNSNDGSDFDYKTDYSSQVINGYSMSKLGDFKGGNVFDYFNVLRVNSSEELSSITEQQVLNGGNLALVGNELIQFKDAEFIGNDTYELTGLLRGRFNTEDYINNHTDSDRFVLLETDTIKAVLHNNEYINKNMYYKNVTIGMSLDGATSATFTSKAKNQLCYPVSDVQFGRDSEGNLSVNYKNRIRGQANLQAYSVPDDLDGNDYEVDILSDDDQVIRTLKIVGNDFVYSAGDQIQDFTSLKSSIKINIYKMNKITGRGKVKSVKI